MASQFGTGLGGWLHAQFIVQGYNIGRTDNPREADLDSGRGHGTVIEGAARCPHGSWGGPTRQAVGPPTADWPRINARTSVEIVGRPGSLRAIYLDFLKAGDRVQLYSAAPMEAGNPSRKRMAMRGPGTGSFPYGHTESALWGTIPPKGFCLFADPAPHCDNFGVERQNPLIGVGGSSYSRKTNAAKGPLIRRGRRGLQC
jgi:hypothetical protein